MSQNIIYITTAPGLEPLLGQEVEQLGYTITDTRPKGITIKGSLEDCLKLNLHLRCGLYVLWLCKKFPCKTPNELYDNAIKYPWENHIPADSYITVNSRVQDASITNTMYPNLKLKDAIVDRLYQRKGRRPDSGPDGHRVVINLYWLHGQCWIYLNTSGNKLSDRNYRKIPHKAPLQETLAAALLMSAGYDGQQTLVLPMCGSGTLAIEAALIAQDRPAGSLRSNFAFQHLLDYPENYWKTLRLEAHKSKRKGPPARIIATDIDPQAVETARKNAQTAGVEQLIEFATCDFAETEVPESPGIIMLNPEYGQRLGDEKKLEGLYRRIGDFFKQSCAGYTGYIFTGNMGLSKKVGLRAASRTTFYNGSIECRLLKYELYAGTRKTKTNSI